MSIKKQKTIDSMVLPSENDEMEKFITLNRVKMLHHSIKIIESAIDNKMPVAELYRFRKSNYAVIICDSDYKTNLDFILQELINLEEYEICSYVKTVKQKVDNMVLTLRTNYIKK